MIATNFKDTSLGILPTDWDVMQLADIANIIMGQSPPSSTYNTEGDGLPFLQGKAEFGETYPSPVKWCSQPQRKASVGSILISVRAPVGNVNVAKDEYCIGRGLASLDGKDRLDNWFLFYQLMHSKNRLEQRGTGSTFQSINKGVLQEFEFPLPPLPEQRVISHVLTTVHQSIEATERVINAAKELKRSMMKHLFTYGPVPVDRVDQVLLKETEIGEIPEEWDEFQVGDFADIKAGGTPSRSKPEYWEGNIPWVKTGEINYNIITKTEETISEEGYINSSAKLIPAGTLLMVMSEQGVTRGRVAILGIDATLNQACAAFFIPSTISRDFLFHYFSYHYETIRNMGHGAHQKNLSATLIKTIPVSLPPFNIQQFIANFLSSVNERIQVETDRKVSYELLFNSLLHHLMTGKVRVANVAE